MLRDKISSELQQALTVSERLSSDLEKARSAKEQINSELEASLVERSRLNADLESIKASRDQVQTELDAASDQGAVVLGAFPQPSTVDGGGLGRERGGPDQVDLIVVRHPHRA